MADSEYDPWSDVGSGVLFGDGGSTIAPGLYITPLPDVNNADDPYDVCDPQSVAYDPGACDPLLGGEFTPGLDQGIVDWCMSHPGACNDSGPYTSSLEIFCSDRPDLCESAPDGTARSKAPGAVAGKPVRPGGTGIPGGLGATLASIFGAFGNALGVNATTCPPGYVKTSKGACVKANSVASKPGTSGGLLSGSGVLGTGLSLTTIAIIAVVLIVIHKEGVI